MRVFQGRRNGFESGGPHLQYKVPPPPPREGDEKCHLGRCKPPPVGGGGSRGPAPGNVLEFYISKRPENVIPGTQRFWISRGLKGYFYFTWATDNFKISGIKDLIIQNRI